jgi:hypothetical protein
MSIATVAAALLAFHAAPRIARRQSSSIMMAERTFSAADAKGGIAAEPSKTALIFIEYQNEVPSHG